MKSLLLLLIGCVAYISAEATEVKTDDAYEKYFKDCYESYGQTKESAQKLPASEQTCLIRICLQRFSKLINEDKSFNEDELHKQYADEDVPESKIRDAMKTCNSKPNATILESCESLHCLDKMLSESTDDSDDSSEYLDYYVAE